MEDSTVCRDCGNGIHPVTPAGHAHDDAELDTHEARPEVPEEQCHRTREHVPHGNYAPGTSTRVSMCPGVGDLYSLTSSIHHPMDDDPFAGLDEEVDW